VVADAIFVADTNVDGNYLFLRFATETNGPCKPSWESKAFRAINYGTKVETSAAPTMSDTNAFYSFYFPYPVILKNQDYLYECQLAN